MISLPFEKRHIAIVGKLPEFSRDTHFIIYPFYDLQNFDTKNLSTFFDKALRNYPHGYDNFNRNRKRILLVFKDIDIYLSIVYDPKVLDSIFSKFLKSRENNIDTIISCEYEDVFNKTLIYKSCKAHVYNIPLLSKPINDYDEDDETHDETHDEEMDDQSNEICDDPFLGILHKYFIQTQNWRILEVYKEYKRVKLNSDKNLNSALSTKLKI